MLSANGLKSFGMVSCFSISSVFYIHVTEDHMFETHILCRLLIISGISFLPCFASFFPQRNQHAS